MFDTTSPSSPTPLGHKWQETNDHNILDKVHGVFHAFIYGREMLFVEIYVRPLAWTNGRVIRVDVMDVIFEVELCPTADELYNCQYHNQKEGDRCRTSASEEESHQ